MKKLIKLIPSRVRIKKDISYEVVFIESFENEPDCLGMCRPDTRQILIKNGQSPTETFKTYIHEFFHAVNFEYDIGITERQTRILEEAIFRVLKLNKILDLLFKVI